MRFRGLRRALGALIPACLVAALCVAPAAAKMGFPPGLPDHCKTGYRISEQWKADVSRVVSDRILVMDGRTVTLKGKGWTTSDPQDPTWTLWFQSMAWLVPLALDDPEAAIRLLQERDRVLPDPGSRAAVGDIRSMGWTQGQFRTRLETTTCLHELTHDARLLPIATRLAEANMDPRRYPGLPYNRVHNHGAMSNVALLQAGKSFGVQEWIDTALDRFHRDMPEVFDECGMMREQSSGYQLHNVRLYQKAARLLGEPLGAPERALGALVRPDGVMEAIGDGQPTTDVAPSGETLWCPNSGWAAATVDGMHFTVRFGPSMRYHGHRDHGGLTWFTQGIPVLSDRGLYDKDRGDRYTFAHDMAAHSVFEPVGHANLNPDTEGTRLSPTSYELTDSDDGITRARSVDFSADSLVVRDAGTGARDWIQHWQLAPGWRPARGGAIHESGARLTIDCKNLKAVKVESFTAWRVAEPAWDLQCRVSGN
ncbi:MAG: hypothetical protein ACR2KE_00485, partial [Candidatus Nanopelagicales bacterium]